MQLLLWKWICQRCFSFFPPEHQHPTKKGRKEKNHLKKTVQDCQAMRNKIFCSKLTQVELLGTNSKRHAWREPVMVLRTRTIPAVNHSRGSIILGGVVQQLGQGQRRSWEENIRTSPKSSCIKHQTQEEPRRLWLLPKLVWPRNGSECWCKCNISHALHNKYAKNENSSVCGQKALKPTLFYTLYQCLDVTNVWNIAGVSGL